jgi:hypothetical protein
MTDPGGDAPRPTVVLPPSTVTLLRPARRGAVIVPAIVFGFTASLVAIGISRIEPPVERPKPQPQTDAADAPRPKERNEPTVIDTSTAEPLGSLVLDTAQSYLATGTLPVSKTLSAKTSN